MLDDPTTPLRAADAARNNAAWCDAVCSAHGRPGELCDSHWLSRAPAPPFYPNLVSLDPAPGPALAAVRALEAAPPSPSWAVKDSFAALSLEREGFRLLFEAEWICRPARAAPGGSSLRRWIRIESEPALAAFEASWGESLGGPRIFLEPLLRHSEIAFLAALGASGAFEAGLVANRSGNAVGLSNFFATQEPSVLREQALEAVAREFPGLPLVGYESGRDLAEARALGFRSLGPLRVWLREPSAGGA